MKKGKWFIILAIIVVLAVVLTIVFINLFTPKYTTELANQITSMAQTGYLDEKNANYLEIKAFLEQQKDNPDINDEKDKERMENYLNSYNAFVVMAEFYSREMLFTRHTSVYESNKDSIIKSLSSANKSAAELATYFSKNKDEHQQYRAEAWNTKKAQLKSWFDNTCNAFVRLSSIYTSCVTSAMMNNEMSRAVFKVTNYWLAQTKAEIETDERSSTISGVFLKNIANAYYTKENAWRIYNVEYDQAALATAKEINEAEDLSTIKTKLQNFTQGNVYSASAGVSVEVMA